MRFYLGVHRPHWLAQVDVPLFVSHRVLMGRKTMPRAAGRWALDSGGFSELSMHGRWVTTPEAYVDATRRYRDEIGGLDWAAPQDWMCEPFMLEQTGYSVIDHQLRTVTNVAMLRAMAPDLPFIPVLQGWTQDDYVRCITLYAGAGIDLFSEPLVGLGSVCRRQSSTEIGSICDELASYGLQLHGFGVKIKGLRSYAPLLASADSMAWSYNARRNPPIEGHTHMNCANCLEWALRWRSRLLRTTNG